MFSVSPLGLLLSLLPWSGLVSVSFLLSSGLLGVSVLLLLLSSGFCSGLFVISSLPLESSSGLEEPLSESVLGGIDGSFIILIKIYPDA